MHLLHTMPVIVRLLGALFLAAQFAGVVSSPRASAQPIAAASKSHGGSKASERVERQPALILAGANGHDTVGGLMPLPLWPSVAVAQGTVPAKSSWKRRARLCCGIMRHPGRPQQ
jgi:hypothetical protein